ncbi:MAG: hypothetical protein WC758_00625 [Candidatus Woesearchaeota archaeon]|jgi:hypothetical protein
MVDVLTFKGIWGNLLSSYITLYEGDSSSKDTNFGTLDVKPIAYISDENIGIDLITSDESELLTSDDDNRMMNTRSVLAAIRGAMFVNEFERIDSSVLYSCFCAGLNRQSEEEKLAANLVHTELNKQVSKEIKNFVPKNIEDIISTLSEYDVLFDGQEIIREVKAGRIKNSTIIKDAIEKNKNLLAELDVMEYGQIMKLDELISTIGAFSLLSNMHVPFLDEYLVQAKKTKQAVMYRTANVSNFCILSKLNGYKDIDLNFILAIRNELIGSIQGVMDNKIMCSPIISFTQSSIPNKVEIYDKTTLEKCYGSSVNLDVFHKLPVLVREPNATIYLMDDVETSIYDPEFVSIVAPIFEKIKKRKELYAYDPSMTMN